MAKIVECVPNFSEGQRKEVIETIANAIAGTDGCNLLSVEPGISTNRTVYTFVGSPDAVVEGALNAARAAAQMIDMSKQHGEHPRIGALDVCPFIPVRNVTMEECVTCANEFGEQLAAELGVPVYLYGHAANEEHRTSVPQIRCGEYEGLPDKLNQPEWKPDFGPAEFVPHWGATLAGARKFLIAYNVNMLCTKEQAHRIALNIREQGRSKDEPGRLTKVQAIGWYLEEANMAQVSVNITDHDITPIHTVFEEVKKDAEELNLAVIGSQIVGLVPLCSLMEAADFYMEQNNLFILEEDQKMKLVVDRLGLSSIDTFNPKERIVEYMVGDDTQGPLVSMDLSDFIFTVGERSPCPGGGSVAALVASLGAALGTMVGFLTYGNKKFAELDSKMRTLIPSLYKGMKELVPYIDHDASAFNEYMYYKEEMELMAAIKMSKKDDDESKLREEAMDKALKRAVEVPLTVAKKVNQLWDVLKELALVGNINCKSDLQVGVRCLETGVWGAYYNVKINLSDLKDEEFKKQTEEDIDTQLKIAQESCAEILQTIDDRDS